MEKTTVAKVIMNSSLATVSRLEANRHAQFKLDMNNAVTPAAPLMLPISS